TACSWFPTSGPTAGQLEDSVRGDRRGLKIVEVTPGILRILSEDTLPPSESLPEPSTTPWTDLIGIGDTMSVTVLEAGPGLFSSGAVGGGRGQGESAQIASTGSGPGATFSLLVDLQGAIFFPYVGRIAVAGRTPREVGS